MIESAPFYWLICDAPDCAAKSSDGSDYVAWCDQDCAETEATDGGWKVIDDGRHYCEDHALNVCEECDTYDTTEFPGKRDYLCPACWAKAEAVS